MWQGRQKLAKFNKREFATLIIDILNDAKRRYGTGTASPTNNPAGQPRGNVTVTVSIFCLIIQLFAWDGMDNQSLLILEKEQEEYSNKWTSEVLIRSVHMQGRTCL